MFRRELPLLAISLLLNACGPHVVTKATPNGPVIPPVGKETSQDYEQSGELALLQIHSEVNNQSQNVLHFEGVGAKSTYKARLHFQSGTHRQFRILTLKASTLGCPQLQWNLNIQGPQGMQSVVVGQDFSLQPDADYYLEIQSSKNHGCESLKADLNFLSWIGDERVRPVRAYVCRGEKSGLVDFLYREAVPAAYSRIPGQEEFLSNRFYCGQEVPASVRSGCQTNISLEDEGEMLTSCFASAPEQEWSSRTEYDFKSKSVRVVCSQNGDKIHGELFTGCQSVITDRRFYHQ